jgi:predicted nucleotidyltransferase
MKEILFKTNPQKVIEYLIQKPGKEFLSKEIQIATKMSKAGANFALNDLAKANLVNSQQKGKTYLYTINDENPVVKQLKILRTIMNLMPLIKKLKQKSSKIILYGSSSRGEDTEDSDIDLFIVTNLIEDIEKIVQRNKHYKKVQPIIRKPLKYIEMEKTDPTFYQEIEKGIVLWEAKDES